MGRVLIIAEAGINHNGNPEIAHKLIDCAAEVGADYIKFQTFKAEQLATQDTPKAPYQIIGSERLESQFEMLKSLELSYESHLSLMSHCRKRKVGFLSSPFDCESIDFLFSLGLSIIKIPSGEIDNVPYLKKIGSLDWEILLSTGASDLKEVGKALDIISNAGLKKDKITLLHCNTAYPSPYEDVNLLAINTLRDTFHVKSGFSDHTIDNEIAFAAVALGACVIEKHLTLDRTMSGPDQSSSIEPVEFKCLVQGIRRIERALGNGLKRPSFSEQENRKIIRKKIVASRPIKKHEILSENNLTTKRAVSGVAACNWDKTIGSRAIRDFVIDESIEL